MLSPSLDTSSVLSRITSILSGLRVNIAPTIASIARPGQNKTRSAMIQWRELRANAGEKTGDSRTGKTERKRGLAADLRSLRSKLGACHPLSRPACKPPNFTAFRYDPVAHLPVQAGRERSVSWELNPHLMSLLPAQAQLEGCDAALLLIHNHRSSCGLTGKHHALIGPIDDRGTSCRQKGKHYCRCHRQRSLPCTCSLHTTPFRTPTLL